ncbi:MAG: hypothetical protein NTY76_06330 [Candidatus Omnitrophica bacterium]|nr:hypothetical protein [Candidatus Omnitrophota bacterium]
MTRRRMKIIGILLLLIFISSAGYADVKLKIAIVNPSPTDRQTSPIRYDLPKGIGPEQVIDIGKLEMKYDFDKGNYYLAGTVTLEASERKVLEIAIRDVWGIPEKDLDNLKSHTDMLVKRLKDTKHFKAGAELSKNIIKQLDTMITEEKTAGANTRERINQYYENEVVLSEVKENIGMLENLVLDAGGVVEDRVQIPTTLAIPLRGESLSSDKDIIELKIKAVNPSTKTKQITPVRYSLPAEISPRYIMDRNGLNMAYDFDKQCFYLYQDDLELGPEQSKEYVVKIRDIWNISDTELEALRSHTDNIMLLLQGTDYLKQAQVSADKVSANIDDIVRTQAAKVSAMEHIAYYRDNVKLLRDVKKMIAELEKLVSQRGVTAGVTVKWPEEGGGGPLARRAKGYKGLDLIAKSIFRGQAPTVATTWKVIFVIIGFIGIIAAFFFAVWYIQLKRAGKK